MIGIIVSGGLSFLFVLISTYLGVNYFKSRNIGQNIQEEVIHHEHKKGTPTLGVFKDSRTVASYTKRSGVRDISLTRDVSNMM